MVDSHALCWSEVLVGVADLDQALSLWVDNMGFEIVQQQSGADEEIARVWNIAASDIKRQVLVRTPGIDLGMIHFVEFNDPEPPVREGAEVFDSCPKNLDLYANDIAARMADLKAAGRTFFTEKYSEIKTEEGLMFREVHMPSHDRINVVLIELSNLDLPFSKMGFSGLGPLVTIVPDAVKEKQFYMDVMNLQVVAENIFQGPEIEKLIGLPAGSALDIRIVGQEGGHIANIEVIEYKGVSGNNLYPRAHPKSLGILEIVYRSTDLTALRDSLIANDIEYVEHGKVNTLAGSGQLMSFLSPAGLRIRVHERLP